MWSTALELRPRPPFSFDASLYNPDHFPTPAERWRPGRRLQALLWQGNALGLALEDAGSVDEPAIALTVRSRRELDPEELAGLVAELDYRLQLQLDLEPFERAFAADPLLGPVLERLRGMRPLNASSLFEFLVIATVLQNATVRRTVQMMDALLGRYGTPVEVEGTRLLCPFGPEALPPGAEDELRRLKLGYRARTLVRLAAAFASGEVDELALRDSSLEEQRRALLRLYGVGPASVGYVLTSVFHRHDEWSHVSPWEQRILSRLLFDTELEAPVPPERLVAFVAERFAGWRALAVHYLWEDLFRRFARGEAEWLRPLIRL